MPTWLITGASGFLGSNLAYWLGGKAVRVGVARSVAGGSLFEATHQVDLSDRRSFDSIVDAVRPDVIVNAAAFASHEGCERDPEMARRVNVDAARHVAHAAASCGARLMHISSDAVFDGSQGNYRETDAPNPFSVYGETKLLGEHAVLDACPSATVARTNFFGWSPSGTRSILEFFVNALSSDSRVLGFTNFMVTSIYAQHLSALLFELAQQRHAGLIHVASSDALTKYDFGVAAARSFGLNPELIDPTHSAVGPDGISRNRDLSLNTDLLAGVLGRSLPTQAEGIAQAHADSTLRQALRAG